jgi:uncharacterized protein with GYD domain
VARWPGVARPERRDARRNQKGCVRMFTYIGLIKVTAEGREHFEKAPEYLAKIGEIIEFEGGTLERTLAVMGPWDFLAIVKYPDNETAFRVLAKIAKLEVVETETFPAEDVAVFMKALV